MIRGLDYYFRVEETEEDGARHVEFTAVHTKLGEEGKASSGEWEAQGYDGEVPDDDVRRLALDRLKDALIEKYVPK